MAVNQAHTRRVSITVKNHENGIDIDGNFNTNVFSTPFANFLSVFKNLFSDIQSHQLYAKIFIRSTIRVLDDRMNLLCSSKLSERAIILLSLIAYREVTELEVILSKVSTTNILEIQTMIKYMLAVQIPRICTKLSKFIDKCISSMSSEGLKKYLRSHGDDFLTYWEKSKSANESSGKIYLSLLGHETLNTLFYRDLPCFRLDINCLSSVVTCIFNTVLHALLDSILEVGCLFDESGVYRLFRIILYIQEYASSVKTTLVLPTAATSTWTMLQDRSSWQRAEAVLAILNEEVFKSEKSSRSRRKGPPVEGGRRRKMSQSLWCCASIDVAVNVETRGGDHEEEEDSGDGAVQTFSGRNPLKEKRLSKPTKTARLSLAKTPLQDKASLLLLPPLRTHRIDDEERARWTALASSHGPSRQKLFAAMNARSWRKVHTGTVFVELRLNVSDL